MCLSLDQKILSIIFITNCVITFINFQMPMKRNERRNLEMEQRKNWKNGTVTMKNKLPKPRQLTGMLKTNFLQLYYHSKLKCQ